MHPHRETGKTFGTKVLFAKLRQKNGIVLAGVSSGIARTFLPVGRTAPSAIKVPFYLISSDSSTCNIRNGSDKDDVLKSCEILLWDECTLGHIRALDVLGRTLRDIKDCQYSLGGLSVLLSGDFRQRFHVVHRGKKDGLCEILHHVITSVATGQKFSD